MSSLILLENRKAEDSPIGTLCGAKFGNPPFRNRRNNQFSFPDHRSGMNIKDTRATNRCSICKQPGKWKNECPNRPISRKEVIKARVKEAAARNKSGAEVLFCLARNEDNHQEYIDSLNDGDNENTFETLLSHAQDDIEEEDLIKNTFDELINNGKPTARFFNSWCP